MKRLENKVAIITGGSAGIGAATAIKFAEEGAKVIIWDLDESKGKTLAEKIGGTFMKVNTANYGEVEAAAKMTNDQYSRIDILINNAGITRDSTLKKMTPEQWQQVIDVNLTGVFYCTKIVSEYMLVNGWGRIVNASSVVGIYGNFGQTNYVATKAGIIGMTKTWARELGRKGVTVNAVAPGFIATEMVAVMPENVLEGMKAKVPIGRLGDPKEIANVYAFLSSDEASYINGHTLSVDGGMTV
jgi:3-oxoacyl-[acyl-carrier protein] reductase